MASSIYGIGTSGLLTAQRQLATAGHNISNVNTEGYARQRAELAARAPQFFGNGYIGTGVNVQTTVRLANEFLEEQIRNSNSQYGKFDSFYSLSSQIDNVLANPDSGLTPTLESFFSALQEANDNPSSTPARQVLITEANTLVGRFELLDDRFAELNQQVNQQLIDATQEITDAARSLATMNTDIVQKIGAGQGDMPNDLMDQREALIKEISKNIDVNVVYQDDGAANLFVGSGQPLVIGGISSQLITQQNQYNAESLDIILTQGAGQVNVTTSITGGELEGVLKFKNDVLDPSRRSLGRVAIALTEEMNTQHQLGMTLQDNGTGFNLGGDFFTSLTNSPQVLPGQLNSTGNYAAQITDSKLLTTSDYQLDVVAGAPNTYTFTRLDTPNTPLVSAGTAIDVQTAARAEGFILLGGGSTADESFVIRPTYTALSQMGVEVNNVLEIALAGPVVSGALTTIEGAALNSGTGEISMPMVNDRTSLPLAENNNPPRALTLTYDTGNARFNVVDAGGATFTLGFTTGDSGGRTYDSATDPILFNYGDINFTLSGVPSDGDRFIIGNNSAPFDDNRNGLSMAQLQTAKTLENGSTDFQAGYSIIVSDVGAKTHSSEIDLKAQLILSEQTKAERESYSGVNLDEEAAALLKYQQAYQASAKVISIADEIFQTLINSV